MNNLMTFDSKEFGKLRTIEKDGCTWFCGKDVAEALGYQLPRKAIKDHCRSKGGSEMERTSSAVIR